MVTESRVTLHALPAVAVVLGGVVALAARGRRGSGWAGASLVLLGGAWFVIGPILHPVWAGEGGMMTMGSAFEQFLRRLGYHDGTGLAIAGLAAFAIGRMAAARAVERAAGATGPSAQLTEPPPRARPQPARARR